MLNNLAVTCVKVGQYDLAVTLFGSVLRIKQRLFDVQHLLTADSWINLGLTYFAMGKYQDAVCCYHASPIVMESYMPSVRPNLPATYSLIGGLIKR